MTMSPFFVALFSEQQFVKSHSTAIFPLTQIQISAILKGASHVPDYPQHP